MRKQIALGLAAIVIAGTAWAAPPASDSAKFANARAVAGVYNQNVVLIKQLDGVRDYAAANDKQTGGPSGMLVAKKNYGAWDGALAFKSSIPTQGAYAVPAFVLVDLPAFASAPAFGAPAFASSNFAPAFAHHSAPAFAMTDLPAFAGLGHGGRSFNSAIATAIGTSWGAYRS